MPAALPDCGTDPARATRPSGDRPGWQDSPWCTPCWGPGSPSAGHLRHRHRGGPRARRRRWKDQRDQPPTSRSAHRVALGASPGRRPHRRQEPRGVEERIVKLTAAAAGIAFPGAALAIRTTRRRKPLPGGKWRTETVHAITDPTHGQTRPAQLADAARAHWGIENRLHWVRDVTFDEDRSQIRTGHGPAVMATLRNLAISLHRTAGATAIARACRTVSRHPNRVLPLPT
ncbi:MAG: transposase [Actinomycetes bacterium]